MCIKGGISRLAQPEKTEFTHVNEYFEGKRNAEITVLDTSLPQYTLVCANFASKQDTKIAVLNGCKKKKTGLTGPISSRKCEID